MKLNGPLVPGAWILLLLLLAVACLSVLGVSAQPDDKTLRALSNHLRPRWIEAVSRPDTPTSDDVLASLDELNLAKVPRRPALVLLFSNEDQVTQAAFEEVLFQHPQIVLTAKAFVCIRVDLRKDTRLKQVYQKAVPRFLLFDREGHRRADISMAGFRQRPDMLGTMMQRVMDGYGSMPLERFAARYAALLPDLVPIENGLRRIQARRAKIARDNGAAAKAERKRLDAEQRELTTARKAWEAREKALLATYHGDT